MPRTFPTFESQRESALALADRLRRERLAASGASESDIVAYTAARIAWLRYRNATRTRNALSFPDYLAQYPAQV